MEQAHLDKPGPELDRIIATQLFGFEVHEELPIMFETPDSPFVHIPGYSTDWNGMQLVVEEMQRRGYDFTLKHYEGMVGWWWAATFAKRINHPITAETAPYAVCKAAILALEGQRDET